jgi:hypothetical protein
VSGGSMAWQKKLRLKGRAIPSRSAHILSRTASGLSSAHASEPSAPADDTLLANATESDPAMGACTIGISMLNRSRSRRLGHCGILTFSARGANGRWIQLAPRAGFAFGPWAPLLAQRNSKPAKRIRSVASGARQGSRRRGRRTTCRIRATIPGRPDSESTGDEAGRRFRVLRERPQSARGSF